MQTEKKVVCIGGIVLIVYSMFLILIGMTRNLCSINETCPEAMVIISVITLGISAIYFSLEDGEEEWY